MKNKKVLITGSAGFIGFHLTQKLLSKDFQVIGIDNINNYYDVNLKYNRLAEVGISNDSLAKNRFIYKESNHDTINKEESLNENNVIPFGWELTSTKFPNYKIIRINLEDKDILHKIFSEEKFDYVVNLAAQAGVRYSIKNPYTYINSNVNGFLNILEGCRQNNVKHLVYASSSSVYGLNEKMPLSTKDNVDHPISLYAATKKSNELMAHTYSHLYKIPTTGLRFFTVYGPWGRPDMALFKFTKAIHEGKAIDVYNYGKMQRDFTYIDDIVEGVYNVLQNIPKEETFDDDSIDDKLNPSSSPAAPYKLYNIGNSSPILLNEFIEAIEKKLNRKAKKNLLPMQAGDIPRTYADVSALEKSIGYKPNTSIIKGINNFIDWYIKYFKEEGGIN